VTNDDFRTAPDSLAGGSAAQRAMDARVAYWPTYDARSGAFVGYTPVGAPITWVEAPREDIVARVFRWLGHAFLAAAGDERPAPSMPSSHEGATDEG